MKPITLVIAAILLARNAVWADSGSVGSVAGVVMAGRVPVAASSREGMCPGQSSQRRTMRSMAIHTVLENG